MPIAYKETDAELAQKVVALLIERGMTVSCAESCTGGLLSAALTSVPGCSAVFPGGCVTYADEIKHRMLGVRRKSLKLHGAVSPQVAAEMAVGMRQHLNTDYALSVTGYAGPGGGTEQDPVGTVYIGVSSSERTKVVRMSDAASALRDTVRADAVARALRLLLEELGE
ncbi:MAG: nicotinamide-nucleotide amidohydrolase family protein [Clostridia bacterium]|nr:nicotinamide-nucleotide amidohydrolase family protein [Clostridia bacterium]